MTTKINFNQIKGANINALDYGAVSGSDNTVAIQAAVNAATAGSVVVIPASIISSFINIPTSYVTITTNNAALSYSASYNDGVTGLSFFQIPTGVVGVVIRDTLFNCLFAAAKPALEEGSVAFLTGSSFGLVENCTFIDQKTGSTSSIVFHSGSSYCRAVGNKFTTTSYSDLGGYGGGGAVLMNNCTGCSSTGNVTVDLVDASISADASTGCIIANNYLRNTHLLASTLLQQNGTMIQVAHGSTGCVVEGNTLYGVSNYGIYVWRQAATGPGETNDCIVANNTIDQGFLKTGTAVGGTNANAMIFVGELAYNITISGNVIRNMYAEAQMPAIQASWRGHKIIGNTLEVGSIANPCIRILVPSTAANCLNTEIRGNYLSGGGNGIFVLGAGLSANNTTLLCSRNVYVESGTGGNGINTLSSPPISYNLSVIDEDFTGYTTTMIVGERYYQYFNLAGYKREHNLSTLYQSTYTGLTSPPATDTAIVGDKVWRLDAAAGGFAGWYCTTAGSPGTWKTFAAISV